MLDPTELAPDAPGPALLGCSYCGTGDHPQEAHHELAAAEAQSLRRAVDGDRKGAALWSAVAKKLRNAAQREGPG